MNKINSVLIGLILFLALSQSSYSSAGDSTGIFSTIKSDFVGAINDFLYIGKQIANPSASSIPWIGVGGAGVAMGFIFDEDFRKIAKRNQSTGNGKYFDLTNEFGNTIYPAILSGGIYLGGLFAGDENVRITGRLCFEGLLLAGVVTTAVKSILGRSRPYVERGPRDFSLFKINNDNWSMPSGHTAVAFTMASVLSNRINRWWFTVPMYALATSTGLARIYKDQHWSSDVIFGAFIGIVSGYAVCNAEENLRVNSKTTQLRIIPGLNGISLVYNF